METFRLFFESNSGMVVKTGEHIRQYFMPNGQAQKIWDSQKDDFNKKTLLNRNPLFAIFIEDDIISDNILQKLIKQHPDLIFWMQASNWNSLNKIQIIKAFIKSNPNNIIDYIRRSHVSKYSPEIFNELLKYHPEWVKNAIENIFMMVQQDAKKEDPLPFEFEKILIDKIIDEKNKSFINDIMFLSKDAQEYIIKRLGPRGILLIKNPDPELLEKYKNVKILNRAGIF